MQGTLVFVTAAWAIVVIVTLAICAAAGRADRRDAALAADAAARQKVSEHPVTEPAAEPRKTGTPALPMAPIAVP